TALGDPVELRGLAEAFATDVVADTARCGVGSVKTNLGHLEAGAGITGLLKVALCLKNKKLLASIHFEKLNPEIQLDGTPLFIVSDHREWPPLQGATGAIPRRAGVSSFGSGGANAHVVLEEFEPAQHAPEPYAGQPVLVMLSAKNAQRLAEYADRLLAYLDRLPAPDAPSLESVAYVLQRRPSGEERIALVVRSFAQLREALANLAQRKPVADSYHDNVRRKSNSAEAVRVDPGARTDADGDLSSLEMALREAAQRWVSGGQRERLEHLFQRTPPLVNLPTYPFARESHWFTEGHSAWPADAAVLEPLHPLVHENISTLFSTTFVSRFRGDEFFLADHRIHGRRIMPAAALLELARESIARAYKQRVDTTSTVGKTAGIDIEKAVWLRPALVENSQLSLQIDVTPVSATEADYRIYSVTEGAEPLVHSQGKARRAHGPRAEKIDIACLLSRATGEPRKASELYHALQAKGFGYGPAHQSVEEVVHCRSPDERGYVVARLKLPHFARSHHTKYVLHPSLLDGSLQVAVLLLSESRASATEPSVPLLPFEIDALRVSRSTPADAYVWARYSAGNGTEKVDITVCDEHGQIAVELEGLSCRPWNDQLSPLSECEVILLKPQWVAQESEKPGDCAASQPLKVHRVLLVADNAGAKAESLQRVLAGVADCEGLNVPPDAGIAATYERLCVRVLGEIRILLRMGIDEASLLQVVIDTPESDDGRMAVLAGISGLLKTASLERPALLTQCIQVSGLRGAQSLAHIVQVSARDLASREIRHRGSGREVRVLNDVTDKAPVLSSPWQDRGVYLITGGLGGLGLIFARSIADRLNQATLVLAGRSEPTAAQAEQLAQLTASGITVEYRQADITHAQQVQALISYIIQSYGRLTGVIHGAGIIRDSFILHKEEREFREVLAAKVQGLVLLDETTRDVELELFVCFSSTASEFGNTGQVDYAAANGFMDAYVSHRNRLAAAGMRYGRAYALNWPLWTEGGMRVDPAVEQQLRTRGQTPLGADVGFQTFERCIRAGHEQIVVLFGQRWVIEKDLARRKRMSVPEPAGNAGAARSGLRDWTAQFLRQQLASVLKTIPERLDMNAPLESFGIDSIMAIELTMKLEESFNEIPETLFFEVQTLRQLMDYLLDRHCTELERISGMKEIPPDVSQERPDSSRTPQMQLSRIEPIEAHRVADAEVAIIGLSGRYPGANTIDELWKNLQAGVDCVTEIPATRWDHSLYYDPDRDRAGKTNSKWGGFIEGVADFDPLFFNISPHEARVMDPQERLFLQCVYEVIEDAGYTRASLSRAKQDGSLPQIGVFVGALYEEYQLYGAQAQACGKNIALGGFASSIANRVSYFFNFHGPSIALDTMCSSSLTALHLAAQHVRSSPNALAIAGGVNVTIHPNKYLMLSQGRFTSSKGRCEAFGDGGDGYVPAEGVGAVLLKRKDAAIADGDHIYGV
ncbi:MAG TPA: SDR family NAD(P)-dependent oxidoreductase, partial [Steroidobacteraceae bacterium]